MPIKKKISSPSRRSVSSRKSASVSGSVRKKKRRSLKDLFLIFGLILLLPIVVYAAKQTIQTRQKAAGTNINKIVNGDFESGGRDVRAWSQSCGTVAGAATVLGDVAPDYTQHGTCGDARRVYGCFTPDIEKGTSIPRCPGWPASGYNQRVPNSLSPAYPPIVNCAPQYVCCTVGTPPTPPTPITCTVTRSPTGDVTVNQRVSLSASCTGGSGTYTKYTWSRSRTGPGSGTGAIFEQNGDADSQVQFASETPGNFNVALIVTDSLGSYGIQMIPITVTAEAPPPGQLTCALTAAQTSVSVNTVDRMTATCSGGSGPYTYRWTKSGGTFQAGGISNSTWADFMSATAGSYNVSLLTTDSQGHSVSNMVVIQVTASGGEEKPDYVPYTGRLDGNVYEQGFSLNATGTVVTVAYQNVGAEPHGVPVQIRMFAASIAEPAGVGDLNAWFSTKYAEAASDMKGEVRSIGAHAGGIDQVRFPTPTNVVNAYTTGSVGIVCIQVDAENRTAESNEQNNVACHKIPSCSVGMLGNNWNPMGIMKFSPTPVVQYSLVPGPSGRTVPNISTPATAQKVKVLSGTQKGIQRYINGVTSGDVVSAQVYVVSGAVTVEWGRGDDAEHWIDRITQTNQWTYLPHYVSASDAAPDFLMIYADAGAEFYVDDVRANSIGQIDLVARDMKVNAQTGSDLSITFDIMNQEFVKEENQSFATRAFLSDQDTVYRLQDGSQKIREFNRMYYALNQNHKREVTLSNVLIPSSDDGGYVKNDQLVQFSQAHPEWFNKPLYFCVYVNTGGLAEKNNENNISCLKYDSRPDLVGFTGSANNRYYQNGMAFDRSNRRVINFGVTNAGYAVSQGTDARFIVLRNATSTDVFSLARDGFANFNSFDSNWKAISIMHTPIPVSGKAYNQVGFTGDLSTLDTSTTYVCMKIDFPNAIAELDENNNLSCKKPTY